MINLLKLADAVTVKDNLVDDYIEEDGVICLLDINTQVLAILPQDAEDVLVHMAIQGSRSGMFYTFNMNQDFIGVSHSEHEQRMVHTA